MKHIISVSIEDWCKLCDALSVSPDAPIADVVEKARLLSGLLVETRRELHQMRQEEKRQS